MVLLLLHIYFLANYQEILGAQTVSQGNKLFDLGDLYHEFNITFTFQFDTPDNSKEKSIFRLTNTNAGGGVGNSGDRMPAIVIDGDNPSTLSVYTAVDTNLNEKITMPGTLTLGQPYPIQIKQSLIKGQWTVQIFNDNTMEVEKKIRWGTPTIYENMKAYACDSRANAPSSATVTDVKVWTGTSFTS